MDRSVERDVDASQPALPGDSPGNVNAPSAGSIFKAGVAGNTEKERTSRVSYQALNAQPDRISRDRHIPPCH